MAAPQPLTTAVRPARRWWPLWVLTVLVLMGLVLAAAFGLRGRSQRQLERQVQEALAAVGHVDPGWHFADLEARREPVPDAENSAPRVLAARQLIPKTWPDPKLDESLFKVAAPVRFSDE